MDAANTSQKEFKDDAEQKSSTIQSLQQELAHLDSEYSSAALQNEFLTSQMNILLSKLSELEKQYQVCFIFESITSRN